MNSVKHITCIILFSAILFIGCAQESTDSNFKSISVTELREQMNLDSSLVILDVRNPYELKGNLGHIDGVINIPVQDLEKRIGELDDYKEREIAVICRSGRRSLSATNLLKEYGFNAKNVEGGMLRYREEENKKE